MDIYVSNLSYGIADGDLMKLFSAYGQVDSAKVMTDKFTGKSRGFGFVEMPDDFLGNKAVKELDGTMADGRNIKVNEARPKETNSRNDGFNKKW